MYLEKPIGFPKNTPKNGYLEVTGVEWSTLQDVEPQAIVRDSFCGSFRAQMFSGPPCSLSLRSLNMLHPDRNPFPHMSVNGGAPPKWVDIKPQRIVRSRRPLVTWSLHDPK